MNTEFSLLFTKQPAIAPLHEQAKCRAQPDPFNIITPYTPGGRGGAVG
jgi:hypothetical protein